MKNGGAAGSFHNPPGGGGGQYIQKYDDSMSEEGLYSIDLRDLDSLIQNAGEIFLSPKGEEVIKKLLTVQTIIEQAIVQAKAKLELAGLAASPDFKSIQADDIKVSYRSYGTKYIIDEAQKDEVPLEVVDVTQHITEIEPGSAKLGLLDTVLHNAGKTLADFGLKISTSITPNTKEVEKFVKEHRGLPSGITAPDRKKTVSITWKKGKGAII